MKHTLPTLAVLALALVAGCATMDDAFRSTVSKRAAFDMSCRDVTVQNIGGDSYGVSGCGEKASYTCVCLYHVGLSCTQPVCTLDGTSGKKAAAK
jgi:hypothetical protein